MEHRLPLNLGLLKVDKVKISPKDTTPPIALILDISNLYTTGVVFALATLTPELYLECPSVIDIWYVVLSTNLGFVTFATPLTVSGELVAVAKCCALLISTKPPSITSILIGINIDSKPSLYIVSTLASNPAS